MTEEDEEILQSIVDDMYDDFVQVIVDGRDINEEEVREIGDGRIYTGEQRDLNLIDELGTMDDTIAFMEEEQDLEGARVVQYGAGFSVNSFVEPEREACLFKMRNCLV
ncbi:S49 family peptidase [Sinobaca sp. H24]|uniref:S49 family peptidase n=1 Tax=Sinobaca sp. H24 TaxID=2923376 RepID=UPI00207AB384|nr:S49 family peptidase [Sinobaca sp. H24]